MTDLTSLIDRVRSGSGADRELDRHIWVALGFPIAAFRYDDKWRIERETFLTSSLDAVVGLVEEKLPGWSRISDTRPFAGEVRVRLFGPGLLAVPIAPRVSPTHAETKAKTEPRAILAALLLALQAQEAS